MCKPNENPDKKFTCPNKGNCCRALKKAAEKADKKAAEKDTPPPPAKPDQPKP